MTWWELHKEAAERQGLSYPLAVAATAPAAVLQGTGGFTKGYADGYVQGLVRKAMGYPMLPGKAKPWGVGVARGGGILGAAVLTTPIFVHSIRGLKEAKTPREKAKYMGAAVGIGAGFGLVSGGIEGGLKRVLGVPGATKGVGKALALSRFGSSLLSAAITAGGIAYGRKRAEKKGPISKYTIPAAVGLGAGFLKGLGDAAMERRYGKPIPGFGGAIPPGIRGLIPSGVGRATSSVIGAVVSALVVDRALRALERKQKERSPR